MLELADKLKLDERQEQLTETIFSNMQQEAMRLGVKFIEKEAKLEKLFANNQVTQQEIETLLLEIGMFEAKIRFIHLSTHLSQKAILTPQQITQYVELHGNDNHSHSGH